MQGWRVSPLQTRRLFFWPKEVLCWVAMCSVSGDGWRQQEKVESLWSLVTKQKIYLDEFK